MNNTNSNSNTSCQLNNSNISSPINVPNVQSPNSQLSQQSKMTDSHQSIDDQIQQRQPQLHSHQQLPQSSVFTIEQIELIRRLKKTNLTVNQFIEAYSEMERLEEEMADKKDLTFDNTASSITYALNNSNLSNSQISHQLIQPTHYQNSHQLNNLNHHSVYNLQNHNQQLNNSFQNLSDDNIELINFKKKGEPAMLQEIKSFVAKFNIRQQCISEMCRISQGYISTFFKGEKMSEKRKNIIYQWYLTYSKNPAKLAADRQQMNLANNLNNSGHTFENDFSLDHSNSSHHFNNNDVLFPITRRDRFIFRKQHLKILEKFFADNPYPEIHAKEQIVEECNSSAEKASGKPLKDADKVTVAIVSNWFNNKRKNARSKQFKQNFTAVNNDSNLAGLSLNSHSLNSSTGSVNLSSQSSNAGYLQNHSPTSSNATYLGNLQQSHHLQQNHQTDQFESNYGYDCNNYNGPNANSNQTNNQTNNLNNHMMNNIVRNPTGIQFKNEPNYNYLDGFGNKMPNANSSNSKSDNEMNENDVDGLAQDHDGSNISEFSSQASFNGNDSIDN